MLIPFYCVLPCWEGWQPKLPFLFVALLSSLSVTTSVLETQSFETRGDPGRLDAWHYDDLW